MDENAEQRHDDEISLADIVVYLINNLKWIIGSGALGLVIATVTFFVNASTVTTTYIVNDAGIDIPFLKRIQQQILSSVKNEANNFPNLGIYRQIESEKWWTDNLKPTFPMNKNEVKDFGETKLEISRITGFTLTNKNASELESSQDADLTIKVFKNAFAFIRLNDLIQSYKQSIEVNLAGIDQRRVQIEVELVYLKKRMGYIETLKLKFPQAQSQIGNQILDPKESASKYLPLNTQLIALQLEINTLNEQLEKSRDEIAILETKKDVLKDLQKMSAAGQKPIDMINQEFEKLTRLIELESNSPNVEKRNLLALRAALADIASIQNTVNFGLSRTSARVDEKSSPMLVPLGLIAGLFGGLLFAFALTAQKQIKVKLSTQRVGP
jgi:hypothetical protein